MIQYTLLFTVAVLIDEQIVLHHCSYLCVYLPCGQQTYVYAHTQLCCVCLVM